MSATPDPNLITPRDFARRLGFKPHYGNQLAKDGRLVYADDGKHVLWDQSLARYEASKDPSKAGVVERHATERHAARPPAPAPAPDTPDDDLTDTDDDPGLSSGAGYQAARAVKEKYLALAAKRDYEIEMGQLLRRDDVAAELASAVVTLRATLEHLPQVLGPQLAGLTDEHACSAAIADHIQQALEELARAFRAVTQPAAQHQT